MDDAGGLCDQSLSIIKNSRDKAFIVWNAIGAATSVAEKYSVYREDSNYTTKAISIWPLKFSYIDSFSDMVSTIFRKLLNL